MSNTPEDICVTALSISPCHKEPRGCIYPDDQSCGDGCENLEAIGRALLAEREAQRERDAKIAEAFDYWDDTWDDQEPDSATSRNVTAKMIASRIRSNTAAGTPTPQDET